MSDETRKPNGTASEADVPPESLDELIRLAETIPQQPAPADDDRPEPQLTTVKDNFVDTITTDVQCKHCGQLTRRVCPTCHGPYCRNHASILDPVYCQLCLHEPDAEIKIHPLIDKEGVTHEGRVLEPSGPAFSTTAKRIADMSRYELEGYIDKYKELIKQAERVLDFRRVQLGSSELELSQRKDAERRALRGIKVNLPGRPQPQQAAKQSRQPKPTLFTADQMLKAVEQLKAIRTMQLLRQQKQEAKQQAIDQTEQQLKTGTDNK